MVTQGLEYAWVFLNIPEYAKMCVNMPKSAWMTFLAFPHSNSLSIWTHGYLFQSLHCSLKRQSLVFFIEPGSICFVFCYRPNSFIRFQISCYLLGAMNLDILWRGSEAPLTCINSILLSFSEVIVCSILLNRCLKNFSKIWKKTRRHFCSETTHAMQHLRTYNLS